MALILADWQAPPQIVAMTTTRSDGYSRPPYESFNLGGHVGDDPQAVQRNRHCLMGRCPGLERIQWLQQVHGTEVFSGDFSVEPPAADAVMTSRRGVACAVLTADCLPVLLCDRFGHQVAAVHAGWRGLCAGILPKAVQAFASPGQDLLAWIGPAISQRAFEVGAEVRDQFLADFDLKPSLIESAFSPVQQSSGHYLADLIALARLQLTDLGLQHIRGGERCTFSDPERFFSYRRDGTTGRMATLIYKQ